MTIFPRTVVCLALLVLSVVNTHLAQGSHGTNTIACIHYATVQRPDVLRKLCVSADAIQAVQRGQALPVGVTIRMDVYDPTGQRPLGRTSVLAAMACSYSPKVQQIRVRNPSVLLMNDGSPESRAQANAFSKQACATGKSVLRM